MYVYMNETVTLNVRMVWPQTHPLHYSGRIAIGGPVEEFSPL